MKFLLLLFAFWISVCLDPCQGLKNNLVKTWPAIAAKRFRWVRFTCYEDDDCQFDNVKVQWENKNGDVLVYGRKGRDVAQNFLCNNNCFCKQGPIVNQSRTCKMQPGRVIDARKIYFLVRTKAYSKNVKVVVHQINGEIGDKAVPLQLPAATTTTSVAPTMHGNVSVNNLGDIEKGARKFLTVKCKGPCKKGDMYVRHEKGDVDLYGGPSRFLRRDIKCYWTECFCAGASADSKMDSCVHQAPSNDSDFVLTAVGYQPSKNVTVYLKVENAMSVTISE